MVKSRSIPIASTPLYFHYIISPCYFHCVSDYISIIFPIIFPLSFQFDFHHLSNDLSMIVPLYPSIISISLKHLHILSQIPIAGPGDDACAQPGRGPHRGPHWGPHDRPLSGAGEKFLFTGTSNIMRIHGEIMEIQWRYTENIMGRWDIMEIS